MYVSNGVQHTCFNTIFNAHLTRSGSTGKTRRTQRAYGHALRAADVGWAPGI